MDACPICSLAVRTQIEGHTHRIPCPRCGEYTISDSARLQLYNLKFIGKQVTNASGWIRDNPSKTILADDIEFLRNLQTPSIPRKAEKLMMFFSKTYPSPGEYLSIALSDPYLLSVSWSYDQRELTYLIIDYLVTERSFLAFEGSNLKISPKGWSYIDSLVQVNPESQIAFVAMWFDKKLNKLYMDALKPGIEAAGYEPIRIDLHQFNEKIDDHIIAMIRRSRFIVAELTGGRGGVYFEAGYALGMGLQVIWICPLNELEEIHFDTRQYNFITWEENELDKLKDALQFRIERTLGRGKYKPGSSN